MLLNDTGLAVNIGKTKYTEVECRGMMTNEDITVGSNSYKKKLCVLKITRQK